MRENSILIQAYRHANPDEVEFCREAELQTVQWEKTFRKFPPSYELNTPQTNAWLCLRDTGKDPVISEVFHHLPQDENIHSRLSTALVQIGSYLYDIGGRGTTKSLFTHYSNKIRRLDTSNPSQGWKTFSLPFHCGDPYAQTSGNFIYLFPTLKKFCGPDMQAIRPPPEFSWAYVYDTIQDTVYPLRPPPGSIECWSPLFVPLDHPKFGPGVLIPMEGEDRRRRLYLHKPDENSWQLIDEFPRIPHFGCPPSCAISNGILYFCESFYSGDFLTLYAHDLYNSHPLYEIQLPHLDNLDRLISRFEMFIVPVSDSKLCFLWLTDDSKLGYILNYAKVSVSLHPPKATLLKQSVIQTNAKGILNCIPLPFESCLDENEGDFLHMQDEAVKVICDATSNNMKKLKKNCCRACNKNLKKDKWRLEKKEGQECIRS